MIKFFRRIRRKLLDEGLSTNRTGNLKRYLLYAVGEILLVMIGILLAIQVNNLNNVKIENTAEKKIYQNFKRQLSEDLQVINTTITYNHHYRMQFQYAIQIIEENDRSKIDTLGYIAMKLPKYSDFDRKSNIYESIVNSGEVKLIKNDFIIQKIQVLEETYIYFNRMEAIHYDLILAVVPELISIVKYTNRHVEQPLKLYDYKFQNIFISALNVMDEKDEVYHRAKGQIDELIKMIDEELN